MLVQLRTPSVTRASVTRAATGAVDMRTVAQTRRQAVAIGGGDTQMSASACGYLHPKL